MSTPALGCPNSAPLSMRDAAASAACRRAMRRPARPGVTATGEKLDAGLLWKKPKPLASSAGMRLRRLTSLTSISEPHLRLGRLRRRSHRHVAGDHRDLGFEVDAPGFVGEARCRRIGAEKAVGAALVHQRIGPELGRHRRAARLAHQLDVVDVGRAVRPLIRARQRRMRLPRIERDAPAPFSRVQLARRAPRDAARPRPTRRAPPAACARSRARQRRAQDRG